MTISDSLAGRRALVTGGSKGTGAAIVRRLAEAGATVMTTARTRPGSYPDPGLFVVADVSTPGGVQQVIEPRREALRRPAEAAELVAFLVSDRAAVQGARKP